jgi:class 3 adenylate cyclase
MSDGFWGFPALLLAVGLGVAWWRARRVNVQLERLLRADNEKLEQLQRQFERFVPADVVERLTDLDDGFAPERRQVTILFADLRGFTAMSERLDPAVTVGILNGYFGHMIAAIDRHHGHVTELVGDGLLALFGALEPNPWQARDAVLAALEMRDALDGYNCELRSRQQPELRFGVGIHCGEVVAGVIGTAGLSKFSVTGDPINVASRIEGLTRSFKVDLLVSDEIRQALDDQFQLRPMAPVQVKGKTDPVQTWHVESPRTCSAGA